MIDYLSVADSPLLKERVFHGTRYYLKCSGRNLQLLNFKCNVGFSVTKRLFSQSLFFAITKFDKMFDEQVLARWQKLICFLPYKSNL